MLLELSRATTFARLPLGLLKQLFRLTTLGEVASMATFTDNSQAILVSQLAESMPGDFDNDGESTVAIFSMAAILASGSYRLAANYRTVLRTTGRLRQRRRRRRPRLPRLAAQPSIGQPQRLASELRGRFVNLRPPFNVAVPEPSCLALLLGLVFLRRHRP